MRIKIPIILVGLGALACSAPNRDQVSVTSMNDGAKTMAHQERNTGRPGIGLFNERIQRPSVEDALPNLYFSLADEDDDSVSVQLRFAQREGVPGPRAMELFVSYPENLSYDDVDSLPSVAEAEKKIIIQQKEQNILRILVFSSENTLRMKTGGLLTLKFAKINGNPGELLFASEGQVFAPADANRGLLYGDGLRVGR